LRTPGHSHTPPQRIENRTTRRKSAELQENNEGLRAMNVQTANPATISLATIKSRQQVAWGSGDYAIIGTTLQIVGEMLCEAVDLRSTQRVLDVAAGNGNATLAAARRFADVVSTDYVGALLERGRERAKADRLTVTFREADAEALPFEDASFDVVLSTFGVMFTPDQAQAAHELIRVCRPGGKIGLANWTPDGFIGQLFKTIGKYVPPAPGVKSPVLWGSKPHLDTLFGSQTPVAAQSKNFVFRYKSPAHWIEIFRTYYGPVVKAFAAIDPEAREALEAELYALLDKFNVAKDGTLVVPSEYLEVVITKRS
jgi:ubiquinone/menaquinone biosynthesis C-methylase UbiE